MRRWALCGLIPAVTLIVTACAAQRPRWTAYTAPRPVSPAEGLIPAPPLVGRVPPLDLAASPEEESVKLTRDGAILTALLHNRAIEVARLGPKIDRTLIPEARAVFDPSLTAALSTGYDKRPRNDNSGTTWSSVQGGNSNSSLTAAYQVLRQLDQAATILKQPDVPYLRTEDTEGSTAIRTLTPLGTEVSLSGGLNAYETNLAGNTFEGNWSINVVQPLLAGAGTGVNLATLRQVKNRFAQGEHTFRMAVLNTVAQVEQSYWDLVLAREVLKIREFGVTLADEQLRRNEDLLAVGKAIEGDVAAARAEKASRTADLTDAQAAIRTQTLSLIQLLNPHAAAPWALRFEPVDPPDAASMPVDSERSAALAMSYRPELAEARLASANADLEVIRNRNGLRPRLDLVASYGRTSVGPSKSDASRFLDDDEFSNYRIGAQFQTPLVYRAERARYRRAKLSAEEAVLNVARLEQEVAKEVRQAGVEVERQWARLSAAREAMTSRAEQLRIAAGRNAVGKTTNLDLLIVQRDYIQSQVDEITARVKYCQALASLYAAEGTLLERRGVLLDNEFDAP